MKYLPPQCFSVFLILVHLIVFSELNFSVADDGNSRVREAMKKTYEPIDLSLFRDSIHHWQMKDGRDRNDKRYREDQIIQIAENLLKYQNADGGWPTNLDWLAQIEVSEIKKIRKNSLGRSSFDNRNTYPQIEYLSRVYQVTGLERYRDSAKKGLEYLLNEQRPTGGWRGKDVDAITFNDDVMVGIMNLLLNIQNEKPEFDWIDSELRKRVQESLRKAIDVTLKCQIVVNGKKTAWCQQHDHVTFEPVRARTYELPSITPQESTGVVLFLMKIPNPSPEIISSIEAAVEWMKSARIQGLRVQTISIDPVRFKGHTAKIDRVEVKDPNAPPIWARFYEIETNRPFFCNRDGVKVYRLAEVKLERRSGYGWYGYWPQKVIQFAYPEWKKRISSGAHR